MQEGYVYLVENGDGHVKIGSSVNPEQRIKTLSLHGGFLPEKQFIYGPHINYKGIEESLHKKFKKYHRVGEWFEIDIEWPKKILRMEKWADTVPLKKSEKRRAVSGDNYRLYQHRGIYYIYTKGKRFSLRTREKKEALRTLSSIIKKSNTLAKKKGNFICFDAVKIIQKEWATPPDFDFSGAINKLLAERGLI